MKIYITRHAATDSNAKHLLNGLLDEPLSEVGRMQLPALVASCEDASFDVIYCSPLQRAVQTATAIADSKGLAIITDERLVEVNPGSFTGKSYDSTIPVYGMSSSDLLNTYTYDMSEYGGETAEQVKARVSSFLDDISTKGHQNVLIVTHGGTLRMFHYILTGEKAASFANATLYQYERRVVL